jgi:membrane protease YdiL (CAAX protease family)
MMILPIIRIIGFMPLMQVNELYWFPVIAIPLFAASYTLMRSQKLTRKRVGLILGNIPLQLTVALSGVILGLIEYLILRPQALISTFDMGTVLFASIILIISTGFAEELLFRGILQKNAENVLGNIYGVIYASILFMVFHIGWYSSLDVLFVFGVSMFYGYLFQKTRSLFGITLSHGICNSVLYLIMPFTFPWVIPYLTNII